MKKVLILILALLSVTISNADSLKSTSKSGVNSRYNDVINFIERGIEFHIFLNGEFDFNTNTRYNNGVRIKRDYNGKVRRVGNVFINYDRRGNVRRIGNVYMNYRFGQLTKVGGLLINYDRWGNPYFEGSVKRNRVYYGNNNPNCGIDIDVNIGNIYDYDDVYFYRNNFRRNYRQIREDNNFYYYRALPNATNNKRAHVIKRRKQNKNKLYRKNKRNRTNRRK